MTLVLHRRIQIAVFIFSLIIASSLPCLADTFDGRCVRVLDGDTIEVLRDQIPCRIRLDGIDCPEKRQAFGQKSKEFTASLAFRQDVQVFWTKKDRYGRFIGIVKLPDGRNLNEELLRGGYAWWYRKYSKSSRLAELESNARTQHMGLWNVEGAIPPWEFRHSERSAIMASSER